MSGFIIEQFGSNHKCGYVYLLRDTIIPGKVFIVTKYHLFLITKFLNLSDNRTVHVYHHEVEQSIYYGILYDYFTDTLRFLARSYNGKIHYFDINNFKNSIFSKL